MRIEMTLNRRQNAILWSITGIVAVLLLFTTLRLALQNKAMDEVGFPGYITGNDGAAYLRDQPLSTGVVVSVLESDTPVLVIDSDGESAATWYYIKTEDTAGWLPAARISLESP